MVRALGVGELPLKPDLVEVDSQTMPLENDELSETESHADGYTRTLTASAFDLKSLNIGRKPEVRPGLVQVLGTSEDGDVKPIKQGKYNGDLLTGMSAVLKRLNLGAGDQYHLRVDGESQITITSPLLDRRAPDQKAVSDNSVSRRLGLRHLRMEQLRPENHVFWEPQLEADVYAAFGMLQEFSGYEYCCGTSAELLKSLSGQEWPTTKPDAILVNTADNAYEIAEFKKKSSDFTINHEKEEVDVLVCWLDDASDRSKLPRTIVALKDIARTVALGDDED